MKIKILHILQSLNPGGLENGVINLSNGIDKSKFSVYIYCLKGIGEFQNRIKDRSIKVIDGKYNGDKKKIIFEIRKTCKLYSIDIVHTHGWGTFFIGVVGSKLAKVPVIINGEHGYLYSQNLKRRLIQSFLFNWVDLNLTVCQDLMNRIRKEFFVLESKIMPILNGVDTQKFYPDKKKGCLIKKEFGISEDTLVIGTVGRLVDHKNYELLLKAFCIFKQNYKKNVCCFIIGDGDERQNLEKIAIDIGITPDLIMAGHRNDIPELLNAMDIFVLNSNTEGLSNTILEAMACGIPVIASNVGGNKELVEHNKTGLLFKVGDYHKYAEMISFLCLNDSVRKEYSENALKIVKQKFQLSKMIENYEQIYLKLLGVKYDNTGIDVP